MRRFGDDFRMTGDGLWRVLGTDWRRLVGSLRHCFKSGLEKVLGTVSDTVFKSL